MGGWVGVATLVRLQAGAFLNEHVEDMHALTSIYPPLSPPTSCAEAELAYRCLTCNQALSKQDIFTPAALAEAGGAAPSSAGAAAAAAAVRGAQPVGNGWQSSAKVDALMEVLRELRGGQHAGAGGPAPPAGGAASHGTGKGGAAGGGGAPPPPKSMGKSLSHAKLSAAVSRGSSGARSNTW